MDRSKVIAIAGLAMFAIWLGYSAAPDAEVEYKVIRSPVKTVTKTETIYKQRPLPEECTRALGIIAKLDADDEVLARAAGNILDAADKAGGGAATRDVHQINDAVEVLRDNKRDLDERLVARAEAVIQAQTTVEVCQRAIADGAP